MKRIVFTSFLFGAFLALSSSAHSQIVIKDFKESETQARVATQSITTMQSATKLPYIADIKKLKKTAELPPEERQALEENSIPDTLYVRKLKQQDQELFRKISASKSSKPAKADAVNFDIIPFKRWFPIEKNEE